MEKALLKCNAAPLPSGRYPVALHREAAADLLDCFCDIFSAETAQKGLSLLAGKEGEAVAAPCVTLLDDPHLPGAAASRPFDDEGVATYRKAVVENGTLQTLLHNLKTARKAGVTSTGNAAKGGISAPCWWPPATCISARGI